MKAWLIAALVSCSPTGGLASADQAPFVRWGMSQVEVEAAFPDARPLRAGPTIDGKRARTEARQGFGEQMLPARFYYDEGGLALISFAAPPSRCQELAGHLAATYGPPLRVSDQVLFRILIWHDEPTARRIRLMVSSAGLCNLYYEPLAEHREHDLASVPS